MKQIILRYGLLSGAAAAVLMVATGLYYRSNPHFENGEYFGYAGILLSMLFVFLGVRAYRDQVNDGALSFGRGFQIGLLIAIISCVCYVLAWLVVYETLMPDFMEKYMADAVNRMRESGMYQAQIDEQMAEMKHYQELYKNPIYRFGLTFLEPFPVGFLVALLSALILRKKK